MLEEKQIGLKNADGSTAREAELCAVSGRPVLGHHGVLVNVNATTFVRVLMECNAQVTDEWLAQVRAQFAAPAAAAKSKSKSEPEGEA